MNHRRAGTKQHLALAMDRWGERVRELVQHCPQQQQQQEDDDDDDDDEEEEEEEEEEFLPRVRVDGVDRG
jgi:hypothetical protein